MCVDATRRRSCRGECALAFTVTVAAPLAVFGYAGSICKLCPPPPTSQPALPTGAAQVSVDMPSSASRTAVPPAPAEAEVIGTPVSKPARYPLSLTRAEYEAHYSQSHLPQVQPANEAVVPPHTEKIRPNTHRLPSPDVSRACAAAATSSTTVSAAHSSPKLHMPRSRKRRAVIASPSAESAAKQATSSDPVLPHPATRASTKSAAVTAVAAPSAVPTASSTSTHANLQQFALPPSRDSSLSPQRPLRIADPNASSKSLAVSAWPSVHAACSAVCSAGRCVEH